jgi:hypothetical protein
MPSKSPEQRHTMEAAAHDKKFADKMGIPQGVAREFVAADERKKHAAEKAGMSPEIFELMQKAR